MCPSKEFEIEGAWNLHISTIFQSIMLQKLFEIVDDPY